MAIKDELFKLINTSTLASVKDTIRDVVAKYNPSTYKYLFTEIILNPADKEDFLIDLTLLNNPDRIFGVAGYFIVLTLYAHPNQYKDIIKDLIEKVEANTEVAYTKIATNGAIVVDKSKSITAKEFLKEVVNYIIEHYEKAILKLIDEVNNV